MESHLKADEPKCVVLAFLCCPDPYYCLILDSQFSLFFLFFWLMIWLNLCGFVRFGGIRRGRFNFWMQSRVEYTYDPQWFSVLCLEKGQYNTPWSISFQGKTKFSMASCDTTIQGGGLPWITFFSYALPFEIWSQTWGTSRHWFAMQ